MAMRNPQKPTSDMSSPNSSVIVQLSTTVSPRPNKEIETSATLAIKSESDDEQDDPLRLSAKEEGKLPVRGTTTPTEISEATTRRNRKHAIDPSQDNNELLKTNGSILPWRQAKRIRAFNDNTTSIQPTVVPAIVNISLKDQRVARSAKRPSVSDRESDAVEEDSSSEAEASTLPPPKPKRRSSEKFHIDRLREQIRSLTKGHNKTLRRRKMKSRRKLAEKKAKVRF